MATCAVKTIRFWPFSTAVSPVAETVIFCPAGFFAPSIVTEPFALKIPCPVLITSAIEVSTKDGVLVRIR